MTADLTVLILTKNEEKNIGKCIESFKAIPSRFVIVDSYSSDRTKEICKQLDKKLRIKGSRLDFYENEWVNYATQFNWGLDNTNINTAWTMRMDADEEILPDLLKFLDQGLVKQTSETVGIVIRRRLIFLGKWIRHGGRYPEYLLRIFRSGRARCENRIMDEHLIVNDGKIVTIKADLVDHNQKSLEWWIGKHNWYSGREVIDHMETISGENSSELLDGSAASSQQAEKKRKIKDQGYYRLPLFFRAHLYFFYRYYLRLGFLDGKEGKIFHFLQAYWYRFLVDAKMYESLKKSGRHK